MFYNMFFGNDTLQEGNTYLWNDRKFVIRNGIPREIGIYSESQNRTKNAFGFEWAQTENYKSEAFKKRNYEYLLEQYFGDESTRRAFMQSIQGSRFLDAGCGAGFSTLMLFDDYLKGINYLGVDISDSVDIAMKSFMEKGITGEFIQADIANLPSKGPVFDVIFSEGVLHHTDSTKDALGKLVTALRPGGLFMFYVYKKKGPIREFTDDYIREKIKDLPQEVAWEKLKPLTKLGKVLGDLNLQIEIPEDIEVLDIPRGKYDIQRLFYWHIAKMYYRPDWSPEENNHVNYDWFSPMNCHRHTPEEVKSWCREFKLDITRLYIGEAGIAVIGRKTS